MLIQIRLSISRTGKGLLETDQGWRVTVNAPESPPSPPPPHGKRSDRGALGARKRYRDDERAAFPPKVQSFNFALLVIDAAKRLGRILDSLRDLWVQSQNAPNFCNRRRQCTWCSLRPTLPCLRVYQSWVLVLSRQFLNHCVTSGYSLKMHRTYTVEDDNAHDVHSDLLCHVYISLGCWYFLALLYPTAEEQWLSSVDFIAFMSLTCWPFFRLFYKPGIQICIRVLFKLRIMLQRHKQLRWFLGL
jgi:hypothetical protein